MGDIVTFRRRREDPLEAYRDEVTALAAEARELVDAARPIVARLAIYGMNASPIVLADARRLAHLLDRAERRTLGGAA